VLHGPWRLFFLLLGCFHVNDFTIAVMSALGANGVQQVHLTAIFALHQVGRSERVVSAATITTTGGMFTFWMRRHI